MRTLVERQHPQRADEIARIGGAAFRRSAPTKRGAFALGVSDRRIRQMRDGANDSIVTRFMTVLASLPMIGGTPFPLVATAQSVALQSLVIGMSNDELVDRFWKLVDATSKDDTDDIAGATKFARTGNLMALAEAMNSRAAAQLELAAVARELNARHIDPRTLTAI